MWPSRCDSRGLKQGVIGKTKLRKPRMSLVTVKPYSLIDRISDVEQAIAVPFSETTKVLSGFSR
jgi:hypothetical protein